MKTLQESLFDNDIIQKDLKYTSLLNLIKGKVKKVTLSNGIPIFRIFPAETIMQLQKNYKDVVLPINRYKSTFAKKYGILDFFLNYILDNTYITLDRFRDQTCDVDELNNDLKTTAKIPVRIFATVHSEQNPFDEYVYIKIAGQNLGITTITIDLSEPVFNIRRQDESLFDHDLANDDITTLYDIFGDHIKKFQHSYNSGSGWTRYFNQQAVVKEWKKEGNPLLKGGFAKSTFPPDLQKFIAVILKNLITTKKQIINMSEDGLFDDEHLNDKLKSLGIILSDDAKWGMTGNLSRRVRIQIGYFKGTPAGPDHGVQFREVGTKRFKGLNTENIELSIYAYDPKRPGFGSHIWTLLTDLSMKDLMK